MIEYIIWFFIGYIIGKMAERIKKIDEYLNRVEES